jgi:hypothetical protein
LAFPIVVIGAIVATAALSKSGGKKRAQVGLKKKGAIRAKKATTEKAPVGLRAKKKK